jgi:hypothetical protein
MKRIDLWTKNIYILHHGTDAKRYNADRLKIEY